MSTQKDIRKESVRRAYAEIARSRGTSGAARCQGGPDRSAGSSAACCAEPATSPDYTPEEIASVPPGAFLHEGSGNPVRAARPRKGETVVDLGCGAGMDSFLAARQVGPSGRVIGFDLTPEMIDRARANQSGGAYPQVEFLEADIARLPLPDAAADVAISNCVINLASDKSAVYSEIHRVLKPGGRFAVSDIVLRGDAQRMRRIAERLPASSCVTRAEEADRYLEIIRAAGFEEVALVAERPAATAAEVAGYARELGIAPAEIEGVTALAVTVTGRKPGA